MTENDIANHCASDQATGSLEHRGEHHRCRVQRETAAVDVADLLAYAGCRALGLGFVFCLVRLNFLILDAGFSQALVREFASHTLSSWKQDQTSADLLLSYERIYAGLACSR
jgi:hypothetical protein